MCFLNFFQHVYVSFNNFRLYAAITCCWNHRSQWARLDVTKQTFKVTLLAELLKPFHFYLQIKHTTGKRHTIHSSSTRVRKLLRVYQELQRIYTTRLNTLTILNIGYSVMFAFTRYLFVHASTVPCNLGRNRFSKNRNRFPFRVEFSAID